jgi:hypothetical protein
VPGIEGLAIAPMTASVASVPFSSSDSNQRSRIRTYLINYPAGRELGRAYVAGEPERFRRLLTEQVRVGDLLEARDPGQPICPGRIR